MIAEGIIKQTRTRDKRTHEQKIKELWIAFGELKEKAIRTGNVNDCSVNKVAARANVGIDYLKGKVSLKKESWAVQEYLNVKNEIKEFKAIFFVDMQKRDEESQIKQLEAEILELKDSFHKAFSSKFVDNELISTLKAQNKELQDNLTLLQVSAQTQTHNTYIDSDKVVNIRDHQLKTTLNKIIISPDALLNSNEYRAYHKDRRSAAWYKAYDCLKESLQGEHTKVLYITVGLPASGKSVWSDLFSPLTTNHRVVILDATNLTAADRFDIYYRFKDSPHTTFAVVYFDVSLEIIQERNIIRKKGKRLTSNDLYSMSTCLEIPNYINERWIDQVIIVRE